MERAKPGPRTNPLSLSYYLRNQVGTPNCAPECITLFCR